MNPIDWTAIILGCPGLVEIVCSLLLARVVLHIVSAIDIWAGWDTQ